jgi:hypothetical protein
MVFFRSFLGSERERSASNRHSWLFSLAGVHPAAGVDPFQTFPEARQRASPDPFLTSGVSGLGLRSLAKCVAPPQLKIDTDKGHGYSPLVG